MASPQEADALVARVRELAAHVGSSRRHANDLNELLALCSADEPRVALAAVQSCRALFDAWAISGDLVVFGGKEEAAEAASDATSVYRKWVCTKYAAWLDALGVLVARHDHMGVRLPALDTLLHMARTEAVRLTREGEAATAMLAREEGALGVACAALSACASLEPALLAHLKRGYLLQYCDVSYYVTQHVARLAVRLAARNRCTPAKCARLLDLLILLRPPAGDFDPALTRFLALAEPADETAAADGQNADAKKRKRPTGKGSEGARARPADATRLLGAKVHRLAFQAAWLALLKLPLARADVRRVLARCEDKIIPFLPRPLQLASWVLSAYSNGGLVALMALTALHALMQTHNLECPEFFPKLYALLDARALACAYRERFFLMAELFLGSALLPAYMTAAFVKRLARLALTAAPDGAQICLALALNLLIRHPELSVLVHRAHDAPANLAAPRGADGRSRAAERPAGETDPYRPDEPLPELSGALDSSLWEVETLRSHFLPAVAQIADKFALPMHGAMAKVVRLQVDEFTEGSYASHFRQELKWRKGRPTPLAFKKRRALFADDEPGAVGLACFAATADAAPQA
jgi:U3 small nucleolar RNA-associated protein 19